MAYKTDLQSNNTDLQSILDMILSLGLVDAPTYLTFKSDNSFTMSVATPNWNGKMYYSLDKKNWNEWNGSAISANVIYIRGEGNTQITHSSDNRFSWAITGTNVICEGNIETLLDYKTVSAGEHPAMNWNCYGYMFDNCTSLITAPELPATILTNYCYDYMFNNCTNLITAPELPATTLADYCYRAMFYGCTSLTKAPELPATTLANCCYSGMFSNCTNLITAPKLPATTLANYCYSDMFRYCTNLTMVPKLPATTLADYCYKAMFSNCTNLTAIPELPATTLKQYCYSEMFYNCNQIKPSDTQTTEYTKLYRIPINGTGTGKYRSLFNMFGNDYYGTPKINTTYYLHESINIV